MAFNIAGIIGDKLGSVVTSAKSAAAKILSPDFYTPPTAAGIQAPAPVGAIAPAPIPVPDPVMTRQQTLQAILNKGKEVAAAKAASAPVVASNVMSRQDTLKAILNRGNDIAAAKAPAPVPPDEFDMQRTEAERDAAAQREEDQQRLKERFAGQGIGEGSGIQEKYAFLSDVEGRKALGRALEGITQEEMTTKRLSSEAEKSRTFQKELANMGYDFQRGMATINYENQKGLYSFQNDISRANDVAKTEAESWYYKGFNKTPMTPEELATLKETNPLAYSSYQSGLEGKSIEQFRSDNDAIIAARNAAILKLDPKEENFLDGLAIIFNSFKSGEEMPTTFPELPVDQEALGLKMKGEMASVPQPESPDDMRRYTEALDAIIAKYVKMGFILK